MICVRTYLIIHNPVGDSKKPGTYELLPCETWLIASQGRTYLARTPHGSKGNIKTSPFLMGRVFTAY